MTETKACVSMTHDQLLLFNFLHNVTCILIRAKCQHPVIVTVLHCCPQQLHFENSLQNYDLNFVTVTCPAFSNTIHVSPPNFAHSMTAELSWHVQNLWWSDTILHSNLNIKFLIKFRFWQSLSCKTGPPYVIQGDWIRVQYSPSYSRNTPRPGWHICPYISHGATCTHKGTYLSISVTWCVFVHLSARICP